MILSTLYYIYNRVVLSISISLTYRPLLFIVKQYLLLLFLHAKKGSAPMKTLPYTFLFNCLFVKLSTSTCVGFHSLNELIG